LPRRSTDGGADFTTSFLDLCCCALGGVILLMVLLVPVPAPAVADGKSLELPFDLAVRLPVASAVGWTPGSEFPDRHSDRPRLRPCLSVARLRASVWLQGAPLLADEELASGAMLRRESPLGPLEIGVALSPNRREWLDGLDHASFEEGGAHAQELELRFRLNLPTHDEDARSVHLRVLLEVETPRLPLASAFETYWDALREADVPRATVPIAELVDSPIVPRGQLDVFPAPDPAEARLRFVPVLGVQTMHGQTAFPTGVGVVGTDVEWNEWWKAKNEPEGSRALLYGNSTKTACWTHINWLWSYDHAPPVNKRSLTFRMEWNARVTLELEPETESLRPRLDLDVALLP
jgi:hypothetical protein